MRIKRIFMEVMLANNCFNICRLHTDKNPIQHGIVGHGFHTEICWWMVPPSNSRPPFFNYAHTPVRWYFRCRENTLDVQPNMQDHWNVYLDDVADISCINVTVDLIFLSPFFLCYRLDHHQSEKWKINKSRKLCNVS